MGRFSVVLKTNADRASATRAVTRRQRSDRIPERPLSKEGLTRRPPSGRRRAHVTPDQQSVTCRPRTRPIRPDRAGRPRFRQDHRWLAAAEDG